MTLDRVSRGERPGVATRVLRWLLVSRDSGRLTVVQWPNIPLGLFLVVTVASKVFRPSGGVATTVHVLAVVALLAWAVDEIVRGVSPFRRLLGGAILVATVINLALS